MDASVPLVDAMLAGQLYAVAEHGDAAEIRAMFDECVADALQRLQGLHAAAGGAAGDDASVREIHQLRGSIGNFGLRRASERMRALELEWRTLPARARQAELIASETEVKDAVRELRRTYPFLTE